MPNELMKTLTIGANTYDLPQKTSDLTNDSGFLTTLNVESPITYTNNTIGFDGYDVTTTITTLCNETVTTASPYEEPYAYVDLTYSTRIVSDPIKVTFNGVEYICPRSEDDGYYCYGGTTHNSVNFSEYPFGLVVTVWGNTLRTKDPGTYTIKIESITNSITVSSDFATARGYSIIENPSQVLVNGSVTTTGDAGSIGEGTIAYESELTADTLKVTFNGIEYICPRNGIHYGAPWNPLGYDFSNYPFSVEPMYSSDDGYYIVIVTQTAGTYTIKIETLPKVAMLTDDFKLAINQNFPGDVMIKGQDYVTAGQKSGNILGSSATAEGYETDASGEDSHAEGYSTTASGEASHAEGVSTTASGANAHAEGNSTTASGNYSHAEGYATTASGERCHAEGRNTTASGSYSHAEGYYTTANHKSQHVFGEYNILDTSTATATNRGNYVEIVGKGTSNSARSNARTLDWNGNEVLAGKLTVGTGPTANMDVATKQYVDNATSNIPTKTSDLTNDSNFISSTTADNTYVPKTSTELGNTNSITYISTAGSHSIDLKTRGYGQADLMLTANSYGHSRVVISAGSNTVTNIITAGYDYTSSNTYTTISSTNTTINGVVTPTADGMAANKKYVDDSISALSMVTSFNGNTGAVTYTAPVTSVNGNVGAVTGLQTTSNLVTSVSSASTNAQYPSAKLFYDTVGNIETLLAAI